jgi:hypothetical protein
MLRTYQITQCDKPEDHILNNLGCTKLSILTFCIFVVMCHLFQCCPNLLKFEKYCQKLTQKWKSATLKRQEVRVVPTWCRIYEKEYKKYSVMRLLLLALFRQYRYYMLIASLSCITQYQKKNFSLLEYKMEWFCNQGSWTNTEAWWCLGFMLKVCCLFFVELFSDGFRQEMEFSMLVENCFWASNSNEICCSHGNASQLRLSPKLKLKDHCKAHIIVTYSVGSFVCHFPHCSIMHVGIWLSGLC